MPRSDGTMYIWEKAELNGAQRRYDKAVNCTKMCANTSNVHIHEAAEKRAFADLMRATAKYAGCK